ncbi:MAG: hypothetical protein NTY19_39410 [Planctomycetota bacterium]|nr:hypothetical protein [Planctomycetota bacterium]
MKSLMIKEFAVASVLVLGSLLALPAAWSADQIKNKLAPDAEQVELFAAMKAGDVVVKLIPKNVKEANVLIENKLDKPLHIKLPDAFAGVPVLAQRGGMGGGGMGGGGMGGGGMGGGGGQQGMGGGMGGGGMGGMGGGGMGGMGGGGMGGFMNVDPGKIGKIKVATVCLEHGKQDPNPRVPYELRPIESFTENKDVVELCKMLGRGEVAQNTAQAAAWHLTNGLTWDQLVVKEKVHLSNGYTEKYFAPQEVAVAMKVVQETSRRAQAERTRGAATSRSASQN